LALPHPDSLAMNWVKNYTQLPIATLQEIFFHPGFASKNLSILTQKIVSKLSETMIRVVHAGSGY
jgi:hypothetical protein